VIAKKFIKPIVILLTLSSLVSCAGSEERAESTASDGGTWGSDCIHRPSIRGYRVLDEANLIVDAGSRSYHVELQRRAFGLGSAWGIQFDSPTNRICPGFSEVVFEGHLSDESVRISSIWELTPEDEEALLIRFGKKEPEIKQTPAPQEVPGADVEELDPAASE
jgi:hypothetical protein